MYLSLLQQMLPEFKHLFCKLSNGWKADSVNFFDFLMHGCATDFLARRCSSEECAGFFRRTHVTSCSGCQNWIIPRMGKVSGGVETSLWQDTQSLFLKSTHQGTHLTHFSFCPIFGVHTSSTSNPFITSWASCDAKQILMDLFWSTLASKPVLSF